MNPQLQPQQTYSPKSCLFITEMLPVFTYSLIYLFTQKEFIISCWISGEVWALALPLRRVTGVRNHAPR